MISRLILILISIALAPGLWGVLSVMLQSINQSKGPQVGLFVLVVCVALLVRVVVAYWGGPVARLWQWVDTLEHELSHALVSTLSGSPPRKLEVADDGNGSIEVEGAWMGVLWAPYVLPLWTLMWWGLTWALDPRREELAAGVSAALLGLWLRRLWVEARPHQSDFGRSTYVLALPWVLFAGVFWPILGCLNYTQPQFEYWNGFWTGLSSAYAGLYVRAF